jgi:hypothetical protein
MQSSNRSMIHGPIGLVLPKLRILVRIQSLAETIHAVELVKDTESQRTWNCRVEAELLVPRVWTPPQQRSRRARLSEVRFIR